MEEGEVEKIESALAGLKEIKDSPEATHDSIRAAIESLNEASHDLARRIYEQASQQGATTGEPAPSSAGADSEASSGSDSSGEEPIVDADFKVKD